MKVFWSWQSDTPGKTGRHFVRDAIQEAIEELKQAPEVEEPIEREAREALHLDHDRKGVSGSPDLARTIHDKIDHSTVFIADVTLVGTVPGAKQGRKTLSDKKAPNPNVLIELGYAFRALGDLSVLMIFNSHYGDRSDLPFDLRHKAGPIIFNLPPDANKAAITSARRELKSILVEALRPYMTLTRTPGSVTPNFRETPSNQNPAVYFKHAEVLARVGVAKVDEIEFRYESEHGFYLRVIPTTSRSQPLSLSELQGRVPLGLQPLWVKRDGLFGRNGYGAISYLPEGVSPKLRASTQAFRNGEIWGFNSWLLWQRDDDGKIVIPSLSFERTYFESLRCYVAFAQVLGFEPPFQVEAGAIGLQDCFIAMPPNFHEQRWGPMDEPSLHYRRILNDVGELALSQYLLNFFNQFYDLTGFNRPPNLFGFPPGPPRKIA
jgi:hypothetical protein